MKKDFDNWNEEKKKIDEARIRPFYHEREIWWCSLGINVGFEQDGTGRNFDRPVVIIKGFNGNIFLGVALTGKRKSGKYYFYLGEIDGRETSVVLSQARLIDSKRLIKKIKTLDKKKFEQMKEKMKKLIF